VRPEGADAPPGESAAGTGWGINIGILPVLAGGLLDGVNPCAFTTIIFLLSALSVAGRSRRETFIIGLFFTVTVFASYYLMGLGFFKIIRIADSFTIISLVIRWLLFGILILFASLSFYDYTKIRAGKSSEILLQLPDSVKKKMHGSIRAYSKSAALAGSTVVMGVLISIFELGCTGQIYFPTITYIIQTDKAASGYLYLALYNLAFILPLAAVFIVVYFGITSKRITKVFQDKLGLIKILTGVLFLCFAALMLLL
jgi:cytochrome c biogenesis protein CcdA